MARRLTLWAIFMAAVWWAGAAYGAAYSNSFDSADAVDDWTVGAGEWALDPVAGTYANTSAGGTSLSVYEGTYAGGVDASAMRDYTVTLEVAVNGAAAGIVARYTNMSNYYLFRYKPVGGEAGQLQLYRFTSDGAARIGTETINPATVPQPHTLVFQLKGKELTGKVLAGGTELGAVSAMDNAHSSGAIGIREYAGASTYSSITADITGNSFDPSPADGADDIPTDTTLTWHTGLNPDNLTEPNPAITQHYVYMSTDINDILFNWESVLEATVPAGGATGTYQPTGLLPDSTYYWAVDQSINDSGINDAETILGTVWSFDTIKTLPVISGGPNDVFADAGSTAELSIAVDSGSDVQYAWYKGEVGDTSTPVGGNSAVLAIDGVQPADGGTYWCRVTNTGGSVDSATAMLYIKQLLAHWTLNEADYSGGQYVDISGGHNATVAGEPNFVPGADGSAGGAVVIDRDNGWASDGTLDPNAQTGRMTISMWVNWFGDNSQHQRPISKRDVDYSTTKWHLALVDIHAPTIQFSSFGGGGASTGTLVSDGNWQHICVSYDGAAATMYINGMEAFDVDAASSATVAMPPDTADSPVNLGAGTVEGAMYFNGAMDDVRIYNYPMGAGEVGKLWMDVTGKDPKIDCPTFDLNDDCKVDFGDLAVLGSQWLECGLFTDCQ